jgi:hypothetical protein
MLVNIPTREDGINEYFVQLDSEQDSEVTNANLSLSPSIDEVK